MLSRASATLFTRIPAAMPSALARRPLALPSLQSRALCAKPEQKPEDASAEAEPSAEAQKAEQTAAEPEAAAEGSGAGEAEEGGLEATVAELEARVASLTEEVTTKHDQTLRALAEAENARRRAAIDVEAAHKFAVGKFAKDLLEVADNLGRAADSVPEELRASDEQPALKSLYEGVVMTDNVLHKIFEKNGLHKQSPLGEKFDPNKHEALFEVPDAEKEPGTVLHVTSQGYMLHERVIRAAGVGIVAKR